MGIRIYQLAKDLNTESKTIIKLAKAEGILLTSHMSTIDMETAHLIEEKLSRAQSASKIAKKAKKDRLKTEEEAQKDTSLPTTPTTDENSLIASMPSEEDIRPKTDSGVATPQEVFSKKEEIVESKSVEHSISTSAQPAKDFASPKKELPSSSPSAQAVQDPKKNKKEFSEHPPKSEGGEPKPFNKSTAPSHQKTHHQGSHQKAPQHGQGNFQAQQKAPQQGQGNFQAHQKAPQHGQGNFQTQQKAPQYAQQGSAQTYQKAPSQAQQGSSQTQTTPQKQQFQARSPEKNTETRSQFFNQRDGKKGKDRRRFQPHYHHHQKTATVPIQPLHQREKKVEISLPITLKDLSQVTGIKSSVIIKHLLESGVLASLNDLLNRDQVELVALGLGWDITIRESQNAEERIEAIYNRVEENPEKLVERAPVVTMMGHVDHGKTTLLDKIRQTNIADGESGGITQHIKAYKASHDNKAIVFLDTPGHEAFTKMRARGANVTDIVILVVAANDGVMPTTEEAMAHAKAGNVKIIVAINKVDLPEANPLRVKQQLADKGVVAEEWGGEVGFVEVSAKTGLGIDKLLERILLEAEILELKANPDRDACGHVLEARKDPDRGILVDILVQEGTLHRGDIILIGETFGKIKNIIDQFGKRVNSVTPSTPVQISGINEVPRAGDRFLVMPSLEETKKVIEERQRKSRETKWNTQKVSHTSFADFLSGKSGHKSLRLIIKADAQGSLEVLSKSFLDLGSDEVKVQIIHQAVGGIIESDVDLADASDAIIIGFRVICDDIATQMARHKNIDIHIYQVIYKAIDELKSILIGMYDPEEREENTAELEILQTFKISKVGTIAGCRVKKGMIERKNRVRLARDNIIIYDGRLQSLKHFKEDVPFVKSGFECGIKIENFDDIKVGDRVFSYKVEKHKRQIEL